ncbi:hypothetical protein RsS62_50810 [Rhizobium dioscoreae]|uniref:carbohydrate binding domain-containing protein n=1 Tax=Rhizobium TaxID=379 RepID=UPI0012607AA6|nr:carbohydrate binding domain-containing protein [Rhizobium dioscoreae]GES45829.1 hypothetical protein RsS62_50810 [Rhizobium dioscoreae]
MKYLILLLNVLSFWLMADAAHAGPLVAAIGTIAGLFPIGAIGKLVLTVAINIGLSLVEKALTKKDKPQPAGTKLEISMGDDHAMSFIIGSYATAGKRKYAGTWGDDGKTPNAYFTDVIEIGSLPNRAGERGLTSVWIDDQKVGVLWDEPHPDGRGFPVQQYRVKNKDYLWIKFLDGTQTNADPYLMAKFGSHAERPWKPTMIGRGCQVVILTSRYNTELFRGVPAGLFEPHPLPLYDVRKDSSVGGNGGHRWTDPSTWEPSSNPAVMTYNLARGVYYGSEWVYGGQNIGAFCLPAANWMAAANACDASVPLDGGSSEPAFRAGYDVQCDQEPLDAISELLKGCNGRVAEVGGIFKMLVGTPGAAVYSFTDDDIIVTEEQDFQPFPSLSATYNAIEATYPEPAEKWATKDAPGRYNADLEAQDGNRRLPAQVQLLAVPFANQVQRIGLAMIQDYRRFRVHQISLPPDAYPLEPNDVVSWSSARNGYDEKKFLVVKVEPQPNFLIVVTLKEVDPADYDWHPGLQLPTAVGWLGPITPPSQPMIGWTVEPSTIKDAGGIDRRPAIKISCAPDLDDVAGVWVQVRLKGTGDVVFDSDSNPYASPYSWLISGQWTLANTDYEARGRYLPKSNRATDWSAWLTVKTPNVLIQTADVLDGAIVQSKIADAAVSAAKIMDEAVSNLKLADQAVSTAKLEVAAVTADVLASGAVISTKLADGAVTARALAQGAVDTTSLASGIKAVEVVSALPTTGNDEGRQVYLTTDGKLYRYHNSAWTAAIAAVDVNGTLNSSQIADNAITNGKLAPLAVDASKLADGSVSAAKLAANAVDATKFASGIRPVEIVSSLPTTGNVEGRTVYLTTDDKLYRYTGNAWTAATPASDITGQMTDAQISAVAAAKVTGTLVSSQIADAAITNQKLAALAVDATKLADNAITTTKIADNAISTPKLQANTVTADKIAANAITAKQLVLTDFSNMADNGWQRGSLDGWRVWQQQAFYAGTTNEGEASGGYILQSLGRVCAASNQIAVTVGETYFFDVWVYNTDPNRALLQVQITSNTGVTSWPTVAFTDTKNGWVRLQGQYTIPAGWTKALMALVVEKADGAGSSCYWSKPVMRRASSAELIVDGSVTASKVAANAITVGKLAANAVIAGTIAANAVTAGTIAAGAVSAAQIAADAITADKLASNSVTTDALAVGSGKNLLQNTSFTMGLDCWSVTYTSGTIPGLAMRIRQAGEAWSGRNNPVLELRQGSGPTGFFADVRWRRPDGAGLANSLPMSVPCAPGEWLEATAYISAHRCTVELRIEWVAADGSALSYTAASANANIPSDQNNPDLWPRLRTAGAAPANAVAASFHLRKLDTNSGQTDSYMFVNKPMLCRIPASATEPTPWSDGGVVMITNGGIVASAVTTDKIAANAVTAGKIAANAVTAGTIAAGAVTATTIAGGTITGDKLAANTIGAGQIAANAITAKQLVLTDFSNMADNGWQTGTLDGWTVQNQQAFYLDTTSGDAAGWVLQSLGRDCARSNFITVTAGEVYAFDVWVYNTDANGANIFAAVQTPTGTWGFNALTGTTVKNGWVRLQGRYTVPSGYTKLAMLLQVERTAGTGSSCYWSKPVMRRAVSAELIVDGAITANKIAVNSLDAITANLGAVNISSAVIGTLQVGTSNIQGGAVTAVSAGRNGAGQTIGAGQTVNLAACGITIAGDGRVVISAMTLGQFNQNGGSQNSQPIGCNIFRDGTAIFSQTYYLGVVQTVVSGTGGQNGSSSQTTYTAGLVAVPALYDAPGAGYHTYTLQIYCPGNTIVWNESNIIATAFKR